MTDPINSVTTSGSKSRPTLAIGKLADTSYRMKCAMIAGIATVMLTTSPTLCASELDKVVSSLLDFIFNLARVVGVIIAVNGVFNWVLANKDENADGQARGIKFVVCGLALVFLKNLADPIISAVGF